MADETGTHLIGRQQQLSEEGLTRSILIGIHVQVPPPEMFDVVRFQQGGTRDRQGFVSGREKRPAVARSFGQVERFTG